MRVIGIQDVIVALDISLGAWERKDDRRTEKPVAFKRREKEQKLERRHFSSPVNARFVRATIILINRPKDFCRASVHLSRKPNSIV